MKSILTWYDARECRPIKNCQVLAIMAVRNTNRCNCMMELSYRDGYFNGKEYSLNDTVRYWAPLPEAEELFNAIKKEDDF